MILNSIFGTITGIFAFVVGLFNLPGLPESILSGAYNLLDILFDNLTLLGLFIRIQTLKASCAFLIIILNFEHLYNFYHWIIRKIPFLNK